MKLTLALLFCIALLSGCETYSARDNLTPLPKESCFRAGDKVSYSEVRGIQGFTWEQGILPGRYKAVGQNELGVFFKGDGRSFFYTVKHHDGTAYTHLFEGGVWIPRQSTELPRLYLLFETQAYTTTDLDKYIADRTVSTTVAGGSVGSSAVGGAIAGALVQGIINAEVGKINLWRDHKDMAFSARVRKLQELSGKASC